MALVDQLITLIANETAEGGNTKKRVSDAMRLLREEANKFAQIKTKTEGPLSLRTDGAYLYFTDASGDEKQISLGYNFEIEDSLNSFDTKKALSANQGRILKDLINHDTVGTLKPTDPAPGDGKYDIYDAGTYNNVSPAITVTSEDLKNNDVYIYVKNGVATKQLSAKKDSKIETWEAKAYQKERQVFNNGAIYEAVIDTLPSDVPGIAPETVWAVKMIGFNVNTTNDLLEFVAANGADLFRVDSEGYFWALYYPNSIPENSVQGLSDNLRVIIKGIFREKDGPNIVEIVNKNNSYAIRELEDGTIDIPKLNVGELVYNSGKLAIVNDVVEADNFYIPDPGLLKLDFSVLFPNEVGIKNKGTVKFIVGGTVMLTANCEVSVQGSGSVVFPKKGYTIDLFNRNWKKLKLKIGSYPSLDSYHLKAYWTDATKSKDIFGGELWRQMINVRKFPNNLVRSYSPDINSKFDWTRYSADAKFALVGIPTESYSNGSFRGQYVLRMKKDESVYAYSKSNQNHLFLDSQVIGCALGEKVYPSYTAVAVDYEIRSPKSPNSTTQSNILRLFTYMRNIYTGVASFSGTHQDYLVLEAWIDWLILSELLGHWDSVTNNAAYMSYDSQHWIPLAIDLDFTLGVNQGGSMANPVTGWFVGNKDIWPKFRSQLATEIKARYAFLRSSVLKMENLTSLFMSISANWSQESYKNELDKWGVITLTTGLLGLDSIDNIINFMSFRLNWLDQQFA